MPAIGLAAFTIGDIAAFGAASIARKMPGWYRAMQAENKATQDIVANTYNHPEQFIRPAEEVRTGRQYVRPTVGRGSITTSEPLMVEPQKIIHPARGKFNPILESDVPQLKQMYEDMGFKQMTYIPPRGMPQQKKMYILGNNKQPIEETELLPILEKTYPRVLSEEEKTLSKQAPNIVKRLQQKGVDFSDGNWFGPRLLSNGEDAVSQLDLDIYHSHIPEYEKIFEDLINSKQLYQSNGRWYGKFSDGTKKVEPDEYIVAHSKAFKNNGWQYDGTNNQRAMTNDEYKSILKDGGIGRLKWTTDDSEQVGVFADEGFRKGGRTVRTIVGNVPKYKWVHRPTKYARELRPNSTSGVEYSSNVPYKNTVGNYTLFGNDVPIKSLRGNNGDFSKLYRGIYKALVPTVIGGTYIGGLENDQ